MIRLGACLALAGVLVTVAAMLGGCSKPKSEPAWQPPTGGSGPKVGKMLAPPGQNTGSGQAGGANAASPN